MFKSLCAGAAIAWVGLATAQAGEIWLTMDQARIFAADKAVGSVVVGNPAIADVTVRSNRELVLFGKMPGLTNITLFDQAGRELSNLHVRVQNPRTNMVTLQNGPVRYTYSCTTVCEQTYTVGDGSNETRIQAQSIAQQAGGKLQLATQSTNGSAATTAARALFGDPDAPSQSSAVMDPDS
jgi:Flp pilus assembly secretin CpaC